MLELLYKDEAFAIIGAAIEVHKELGCGFLEAVYQEALEIELRNKSISFKSQHALAITYKGNQLQKEYVADFICYDKIIVELKALDRLSSKEESQILNYLKATDMKLGLLINFGSPTTLEWKRFIR
ncbi:MAG: GxxExxY protein [Ignavibacteriales bacterium]|nr:GxxExxY protein [Ignavibacteriales bacterium]